MSGPRFLYVLIAVLLVLSVLQAAEPESCPWINAATVAGALGGAVTARFHRAAGKEGGICLFEHKAGAFVSTLRIQVKLMTRPEHDFAAFSAQCPAHSNAIQAIGNQALACHVGRPSNRSEQIIGRVRNQAFLVRVHPGAGQNTPYPRERVRQLAEAVAGSLF